MPFVPYLQPFLEELKLKLSPEQAAQFELLGENLLADPLYPSVSKILSPEDIATKHFLDSLAPLALPLPCWRSNRSILDLGTGGGFPSMPLALMLPNRKVFAVDSKGKAIDFVNRTCAKTGLKNMVPLLSRGEELGHNVDFREKIDLVVCRAVSSVRVLLELCMPLARLQGYILMYKGPDIEAELGECQKAFQVLGIKREECHVHELKPPQLPFHRSYILIEKKRPVPPTYPRRNGLPASHPL